MILGFLSKKYVSYKLGANALIVSLGQIRSKMTLGFGFPNIYHIWAQAWAVLGHVLAYHPHWVPHTMLIILVAI